MSMRRRQVLGSRYTAWLAGIFLLLSVAILIIGGITAPRLIVFGLAVCNVFVVFVLLRRTRR